MRLLSVDVWHTLIYLTPGEEDRYYDLQIAIARDALESAALVPGESAAPRDQLRRIFEEELSNASQASGEGRTVTPRDQILSAGRRAGRRVDVDAYLGRLATSVEEQPFRAAPGARDALRRLRARGYRLGIVGNTVGETGASLRRVLARLDLSDGIECFVFSDEHPWAKPSPEPFRLLLRTLGATEEETVHIGDSWADLEGARRAGLRGAIQYLGLGQYGSHYHSLNLRGEVGDSSARRSVHRWDQVPSALDGLWDERSGSG